MQKAEGRRQNLGGRSIKWKRSPFSRPPWRALGFAVAASIIMLPHQSFADGGTLRLSQRWNDRQISVFTSPAVLRAGPIDISVLIQDAQSGRVCTDAAVDVELGALDPPLTLLHQTATTDAATNKLFKAALLDIPHSGPWKVRVFLRDPQMPIDSATEQTSHEVPVAEFELAIAPPLPAWLDLAPWLVLPFAAIAFFGVHQWLAAKSHRATQRRRQTQLENRCKLGSGT
jgi:hypothetical protein